MPTIMFARPQGQLRIQALANVQRPYAVSRTRAYLGPTITMSH